MKNQLRVLSFICISFLITAGTINRIPRGFKGSPLAYILLHFNNSTTDSATGGNAPHTMTDNSTSNDAVNFKWGANSRDFDGSTSYLTAPDSPDWDICGSSTGNYTLDMWVKHTDHAGEEAYLAQGTAANNKWLFYHANGNGLRFLLQNSGVVDIDTGFGGEITDTNWHHIALIKVGSKYACYLDGSQCSYTDDSSTGTFADVLNVGSYPADNRYFDGNIDELMISPLNHFNAAPNVGETDTITVPTGQY